MNWTTWIIVIAIMQFIHFLGTWRLYQLAGRKAWEAIIPFYSIMVWLKILQRPAGWFFIPFIPIIGPIMLGILWFDTPKSFGKATKFSLLAVITLGFYLFYLNYIEVPAYQKIEKNKRKETFISALLYAVLLATFIHTFMIQPFTLIHIFPLKGVYGSKRAVNLGKFIQQHKLKVDKIYQSWPLKNAKEFASFDELQESIKLYQKK